MKSSKLSVDKLLEDIETPRTIDELEHYIDSVMEMMMDDNELLKLARIRTGLFREFFQELIPLAIFGRSNYCCGDEYLNIIVGSQKYDAVIKRDGKERLIEFSNYINGMTHFNQMKQLNINGYTDIIVGDVFHSQAAYLEQFERCVNFKSSNGYENTEIVFVVNVEEIHNFTFEFNVDELREKIFEIIHNADFGQNKVYLMLSQEFNMFSNYQITLVK